MDVEDDTFLVAIPLPLPQGHKWGLVGYHFINDDFERAEQAEPFQWLYANCREPWHWNILADLNKPTEYRVTRQNNYFTDNGHLCFHFESRDDAILFKLTWGGA